MSTPNGDRDDRSASLERLARLPERAQDGHKGTFGSVAVIGGRTDERVMIGGPALAARAALRSGCGLAVLAVPEPSVGTALAICPEATAVALPVDANGALVPSGCAERIDEHLASVHASLIGPGIGTDDGARAVVARHLAHAEAPIVVDADALNLLATMAEVERDLRAPVVLTPHPGELARLAAAFGIDGDAADEDDRAAIATALALRLGVIVVAKGASTFVTDGLRAHEEPGRCPALATGGSGDVLAGVLAGLLAQFHPRGFRVPGMAVRPEERDAFECAAHAVRIHAAAGRRWSEVHGDAGLLAGDLADLVPECLRSE